MVMMSQDLQCKHVGDGSRRETKTIAGIDQEEIEDPTLLSDAASLFCSFNGVEIHHTISEPDDDEHNEKAKGRPPMILLHGFGSSLFTWARTSKDLANASRAKVVAFDRPAFGLTSRAQFVEDSTTLNPYSRMFSALTTLFFVNFLAASKSILVGHSAGALAALDTYFEAPENVAALILVAPAVIAPFGTEIKRTKWFDSNARGYIFTKLWSILSCFAKLVAEAMRFLFKKALSVVLRSTIGLNMIRMVVDKFGISFLRYSWYDQGKLTDHVLEGYTKPLRVKGWDKALAEYTLEMLTDFASKAKRPLAERLSQISCPASTVLIITGDSDRVVPAWNSVRLSQAIKGSYLQTIKNCGHIPHEEKADEFVSVVDKFLKKAL